MRFTETALPGAFIIELEPVKDKRGFFARSFCRREFMEHGLNPEIAQCNISFNRHKGTIRGMHYQAAPMDEAKLVRCTSGAIYDVIIDLRPSSPMYLKWFSVELAAEDYRMLYIPAGFAHGFQTLADNTGVFYQMSQFYSPAHGRGIRWDDPAFGIKWPLKNPVISEKDRSYEDFDVTS
jgi:dTDP-4-dehydrorhamnose 3,5-epimerase